MKILDHEKEVVKPPPLLFVMPQYSRNNRSKQTPIGGGECCAPLRVGTDLAGIPDLRW